MKNTKRNVSLIQGKLEPKGLKIALIVAKFNEFFTEKLLEGALDALLFAGVEEKNIDVVRVPGSFEIPLIVRKLLRKKRYDALITLGVVLKGGTRHYKQVSDGAAWGTLKASLESDVPVIHGVITAETKAQAIERAGGKLGNRGRQAALSALEMASLIKAIEKR